MSKPFAGYLSWDCSLCGRKQEEEFWYTRLDMFKDEHHVEHYDQTNPCCFCLDETLETKRMETKALVAERLKQQERIKQWEIDAKELDTPKALHAQAELDKWAKQEAKRQAEHLERMKYANETWQEKLTRLGYKNWDDFHARSMEEAIASSATATSSPIDIPCSAR